MLARCGRQCAVGGGGSVGVSISTHRRSYRPCASMSPPVVVIGAGAAGLAALKELRAAGLKAVAYESRQEVGGVWLYEQAAIEGKGRWVGGWVYSSIDIYFFPLSLLASPPPQVVALAWARMAFSARFTTAFAPTFLATSWPSTTLRLMSRSATRGCFADTRLCYRTFRRTPSTTASRTAFGWGIGSSRRFPSLMTASECGSHRPGQGS